MIKYIKARRKELTTKVGVFIPIIPTIVPLSPYWTLALVFIGIVLIGLPEDKFRQLPRKF